MSEKPVMSVDEVRKLLPHRYPFLLIDRVIRREEAPNPEVRVGRKIVAIKNVTINEPFFDGHFPHRPVMPGVLIVEALAQACGLACAKEGDPEFDLSIVSLNNVKFRRPVVPGDQLELHGWVIKDRGKMLLLGGEAYVAGEVVAEAEILAHVVPKSEVMN